jgi:hypothetical protein
MMIALIEEGSTFPRLLKRNSRVQDDPVVPRLFKVLLRPAIRYDFG